MESRTSNPERFLNEHKQYAVSAHFTQRGAPIDIITDAISETYMSPIEALKEISRIHDKYRCVLFKIHIVDINLNYDEVDQLLNYYNQTYPQT